jgi:type IV pilus assembly protein PilE
MLTHCKSKQKGFNLIELMVTVAILGLLFAIAVPQYSQYSLRANRTDGVAILNEILQAQERYAADNGVYTSDLAQLGYGSAPASADGHYVVSAGICGAGITMAQCVLLTATAQGSQDQDENGNNGDLSINTRGTKVGF